MRQAVALDATAFAPIEGLRNAAGVVLVLALGLWLHSPTIAVVAAAGALNAGIVSLLPSPARTRQTLALAVFGLALATFLGTVTGAIPVLNLAVLGLLAFIGGLFASTGPVGTTVVVQSLIGFIVFGRFHASPLDAAALALMVLTGGGVQWLLNVLVPVDHRPPTSGLPASPTPSLSDAVATVLRELHTRQSEAWWHALRLTIAVVVAEVLAQWLSTYRGYWIPVTVVVVLRPEWMTTSQRIMARWLGTLLGVLVAGVALARFSPHGAALIVTIGVVAWAAFTSFPASYALFSGFVAAFIVLLLELVLVSPAAAAVDRAVDTVIGGMIAVLAFRLVRPQVWERLRRLSPFVRRETQ